MPAVIYGTTVDTGNSFDPPCVDETEATQDVTYLFLAPVSGTYWMSTRASSFDTVLYVLEGVCSDVVLGCNDDDDESDDTLTSAVEVDLEAGEVVTVVVDGFNAEEYGTFSLRIDAEEESLQCESLSSMVPQTVGGSTDGGQQDLWSTDCWASGPEVAYTWSPPQTGFYVFDTFGSQIDTVLSIAQGNCEGDVISCNDDAAGQFASSAGVLADEGDVLTVVVEGKLPGDTGEFILNVTSGSCPEVDLGSVEPHSLLDTTATAGDMLSGSCADEPAPGHVYHWRAPVTGAYRFDTYGSKVENVLFIRDGDCSGPELGCSVPIWEDDDDDGDESWGSEIELELVEGQEIAIGVESRFADWVGAYRLNIERLRSASVPRE
ncbi:MAG: hypothetical protein B7733_23635 [Myxococcales bacterium FL481]|nr:MAG: hypothetical protein B7733_23635 [Myxococcales bacterium FL481]